MKEVWFYRLGESSLEAMLPRFLEKLLEQGRRAVVRASSAERVAILDTVLWTYREDSFLPHGVDMGEHCADQPVFLTLEDRNPNGSNVLFLVDGILNYVTSGYERIVYLLEGGGSELDNAILRIWEQARGDGHEVVLWERDAQGRWIKRTALRGDGGV